MFLNSAQIKGDSDDSPIMRPLYGKFPMLFHIFSGSPESGMGIAWEAYL